MSRNYKQTDPRWNYLPFADENINNAGCGPTSVADGLEIFPSETAAWLQANGFASHGYGMYWEGVPAGFRHWNVSSEQLNYSSLLGNSTSAVFEKFKKCIQDGFCGVLLMGNSGKSPVKWTNSGHYIFVAGYKDGKYNVFDPANAARDGWHPWEDFIPSIKICYTTSIPTGYGPTDYAYSFDMGWLHENSKGEKVKLMQKLFAAYGWYKGKLDGDYGPLTVEACKLAQRFKRIEIDGSCGIATQSAVMCLVHEGMKFFVKRVKKGDNSDSARFVQCLLQQTGFYNGAIDGDAGKMTEKAIMDFQRANGLKVDGDCGKDTLAKLIGF